MPLDQTHRAVAIAIEGVDQKAIAFHRMRAYDALSEPFRFDVEILSIDGGIRPQDMIGANATVRLEIGGGATRYYNGYIASFGLVPGTVDHWHYEMELRPWFWFLTQTRASRIFQNMPAPDIIKNIFSRHGFGDVADELVYKYKKREYCVQYNESDFDFVSRLMEDEGIFYLFRHENGRHEMVLADDTTSNWRRSGHDKVRWHPSGATEASDVVTEWRRHRRVLPNRFSVNDFNFETPKAQLEARSEYATLHKLKGFELYEHPAGYVEADAGLSRVSQLTTAMESRSERVEGAGSLPGLSAGFNFELQEYPREDQNKVYTVLSIQEEIVSDSFRSGDAGAGGGRRHLHHCRFVAQPTPARFWPERRTPKPLIHGPQTAIVTGKKGEEIWTDEHGRVKVQFHWDRDSKGDENSSCWIRVSQALAGKNWGAIALPRIGQEVIVEFLEGDPDRPIITGRVYNGDAKTPYTLPDKATVSTFMTLSSKGGGGYNELRFEDKKGKEQVFIHAERNFDTRVKAENMETTGGSRHEIVGGDHKSRVEKDAHRYIKGDSINKVDGELQFKIGAGAAYKTTGMHAIDASETVWLKSMKILLEADMEIMLKAGGSSIYLGPAGIQIQGAPLTTINSGPGGPVVCVPPMMDDPKEPAAADNGKAGATTEAKAPDKNEEERKQQAGHQRVDDGILPDSFAAALQAASSSGAPFVSPTPTQG